jgi:hypothetical protein
MKKVEKYVGTRRNKTNSALLDYLHVNNGFFGLSSAVVFLVILLQRVGFSENMYVERNICFDFLYNVYLKLFQQRKIQRCIIIN